MLNRKPACQLLLLYPVPVLQYYSSGAVVHAVSTAQANHMKCSMVSRSLRCHCWWQELARRGCTLYMVCRSEARGKDAVEQVKKDSGNTDVHLKVQHTLSSGTSPGCY